MQTRALIVQATKRLKIYSLLIRAKRKAVAVARIVGTPSGIIGRIHRRRHRRCFSEASRLFYKRGDISGSLRILENLCAKGVPFDKKNRDFLGFIHGISRLRQGWELPPRQPNPDLLCQRNHLLYCLHQSLPYTTNGYSTRSHGIAEGLRRSGWTVRVTTRPGFPWDAGVKGLDKGYQETLVDGVTYAAVAGWNLSKTPLDHYLHQAADHFLQEAQTSGAEMIVAVSNHITALPALTAARRLGLPFVYEVRGLWEVTQASMQPEWAGSERYHLMCELEALAAREADLIITLTEELAEELVRRGVARSRIVIVPNAVDAVRFSPRKPDPEIVHELSLPLGVPVIGYAGSAVAYEGLELLMEALKKLKEAGETFVFVLVGDGKVTDTVKAQADALGLSSCCRFVGRIPFEQVPRYLSCMNIIPIPRLSSAVTEMVSALKPLEAMAMGKAVVLSDVAPHILMANGNERARLFRKDEASALCASLKSLLGDAAQCQHLGRAARAWIERERTWQHVTSVYASALQQVRESARQAARDRLSEGVKRLEQITLGLIADRFTTETLASAIEVVPLSPDDWLAQLAKHPIDALLVESAWEGNDGQWHRRVGDYRGETLAVLESMLEHCRREKIPTLFWNKEDPVHFERFRRAASLCDHVFTTDSRRIIPYLATPESRARTASSCPFYASPGIHNPLPSTRPWSPTAAYGGTYYGGRYPERTEFMDKIMSAAAPLGLTIYDRQHDDPASSYRYPEGLSAYIAGSLGYEEMIQAYKAHPVQINVNSVLDSPTMFSRRVMEAAACGAPVISGPALGMNRYLGGAAQVVRNETEAAQALERLLHHPAHRWRMALKGMRAVMRAHTSQHRLVQMLRTAGMVIMAPRVLSVTLHTPRMTAAVAQRLLMQTLLPWSVVADRWQPEAREQLAAAGIACREAEDVTAQENENWLLAREGVLEDLEAEDLEDLAWAASYSLLTRIGFNRGSLCGEGEWPGVAALHLDIDPGLQLIRVPWAMELSALWRWADEQPPLALRKPSAEYERPPDTMPRKTVVIAGHDLKFIRPFFPYFTKEGFRLLLDFWRGHNRHDEAASRRLLSQADTIFCEWMLGNAIWYGKHKREGQRLAGRLHLQELDHALFPRIALDAFDVVIFVGPHIQRQATTLYPALKRVGTVVSNGVDVDALRAVPRLNVGGKVLGLVGMVPQRKRFDLALDILRELRKEDPSYTLRIKGKRPEAYAWMANRPQEMQWYETQYRRLQEDALLAGAVFFDPHDDDMANWYAGVNHILSVSDFESFHLAVAEGATAGCRPILFPWEGASDIYPGEWIVDSVDGAVAAIRASAMDDVLREGGGSDFRSDDLSLSNIARRISRSW